MGKYFAKTPSVSSFQEDTPGLTVEKERGGVLPGASWSDLRKYFDKPPTVVSFQEAFPKGGGERAERRGVEM